MRLIAYRGCTKIGGLVACAFLTTNQRGASGYGTERLRPPAATERSAFGRKKAEILTYVNEDLDAFVRSRSYESAVARSTARTGLAPG